MPTCQSAFMHNVKKDAKKQENKDLVILLQWIVSSIWHTKKHRHKGNHWQSILEGFDFKTVNYSLLWLEYSLIVHKKVSGVYKKGSKVN